MLIEVDEIIPNLAFQYNLHGGQIATANGIAIPRSPTSSSRPQFIYDCPETGERYVIKTDGDGDIQCDAELKLFATIDENDSCYFLPIVAGKETRETDDLCAFVIQKFTQFDYPSGRVQFDGWRRIQHIANKYEVYTDLSDDYHNWAFVEGLPIIYDYGCNPFSN